MAMLEDHVQASGHLRCRAGREHPPTAEGLGASGDLVERDASTEREYADRWQEFIDKRLVEWGRDPSALAEEGDTPPTLDTISQACRWARLCKEQGLRPPTRIVLDGAGGIAFELQDTHTYSTIMIYARWEGGGVRFQGRGDAVPKAAVLDRDPSRTFSCSLPSKPNESVTIETVYRRIPVSKDWYDPTSGLLSHFAFRPRDESKPGRGDGDDTGISLVQAEPVNTAEEAAAGPAKQGYYVAAFNVGELRKLGMDVVSKPVEGVKGHVEIPELRIETRDTNTELTPRPGHGRLVERSRVGGECREGRHGPQRGSGRVPHLLRRLPGVGLQRLGA